MSQPDSTDTESTVKRQPSECVFETARTENILVACGEFPTPKWVYVVDDTVYRLQTTPKEVHQHHYAVGVSKPDSSKVELLTFHDSDAGAFQCLIPKFPPKEEIKQEVDSVGEKILVGNGNLSADGTKFEVGDAVGCNSFIAVIVDVLSDDLLVERVIESIS